ncbi:hypothetical protein [uncultured Shewanella sp.]|uniref:hypothetical protein n=1 Tax=uncultured Shewanella sp. TaxID=173975 RepID=UPI002604ABE9|nr:hypothetical protein [uncultured Shewanella sp.]
MKTLKYIVLLSVCLFEGLQFVQPAFAQITPNSDGDYYLSDEGVFKRKSAIEIRYSILSGPSVMINLADSVMSFGGGLYKINNCPADFPKHCIKYGEHYIFVTDNLVNGDLDKPLVYEVGKNSIISLPILQEYSILDQNLEGYSVRLKNTVTGYTSDYMFYSRKRGVLFFRADEGALAIASSYCGLFAPESCKNPVKK